jgi:transcriptional regulator with XRE-family HTH domain
MNETGKNIKKELENKQMSQKQLCQMTGISESAMSKYLSGTKEPRSDILSKIARALDVSIYQLLGIQEKEGTTFDICKTALLARSGSELSNEEKKELIDLIFGHK